MCEETQILRLCTCDTDSTNEKEMWVLYSVELQLQKLRRTVGRIKLPSHNARSKNSISSTIFRFVRYVALWYAVQAILGARLLRSSRARMLIHHLNTYDVFDFDYTPRSGDFLVMRIESELYIFKFSSGKNWKLTSASIEEDFSNIESKTGNIFGL